MNSCQLCDQKPYIRFNWKYANEGRNQELARFMSHLQPIRPLKFGYLYQCPASQNYWFLDDDHSFMHSVPSDKVELLWQWDRMSLSFTSTQIEVLSKIGATGSDGYRDGKGEIRVPCTIRRVQDEFYDPALVIVTKLPPIQRWQKRVLIGNKTDVIAQSELALPLSLRIATHNATEISMGFAPTLVKSSDNQYFVLSGPKQIISYGQLKGKDLSLSAKRFRRGDNFPILEEDIDQITFCYYDWYQDCHKLVPKSAG
jgi:hypothetical protein